MLGVRGHRSWWASGHDGEARGEGGGEGRAAGDGGGRWGASWGTARRASGDGRGEDSGRATGVGLQMGNCELSPTNSARRLPRGWRGHALRQLALGPVSEYSHQANMCTTDSYTENVATFAGTDLAASYQQRLSVRRRHAPNQGRSEASEEHLRALGAV